MRRSARILVLAAAVALAVAACSPAPDTDAASQVDTAKPAAWLPTEAQVAAFEAEGPEPTLRQLTSASYVLHYRMMERTGMVEALGGEAQALAALQAVGNAYERQVRGVSADAPRMLPAAFTGEGMSSGLIGLGMGGFAGLLGGGLLSGEISRMSDTRLAELVKEGPIKLDGKGGSLELKVGEDGSLSQDVSLDVDEAGVTGKVRIQTHMDACPDASGKITVRMKVDSSMQVTGKPGVGGNVHSDFTYERYLDDDAQLMRDNGGASELRIRMEGIEGGARQSFEVTTGHGRDGTPIFQHHDEAGFSIFRMEEVGRAQEMLRGAELLQTLIAEAMLRGLGSASSPWEGGRCVQLDVSSDPSKRTAARPNTAYALEAKPRAKSDGAPAGGTVVATLSGNSSLQPNGSKVKADAKFDYANPAKADESASVTFEARSKRGVGRASLAFDTKRKHAYHAEGGLQAFHGTGTICDLAAPFTISGGGNTVTFTPTRENSGTYTYQGVMGTIGVYGSGTWSATVDENGGRLTGTGNGCVKTPMGTRCANDTERYTLTPIPPCAEE